LQTPSSNSSASYEDLVQDTEQVKLEKAKEKAEKKEAKQIAEGKQPDKSKKGKTKKPSSYGLGGYRELGIDGKPIPIAKWNNNLSEYVRLVWPNALFILAIMPYVQNS